MKMSWLQGSSRTREGQGQVDSHPPRSWHAIVFVSFARGTATRQSKLDLAPVINTDRRFLERYEHVRGIEKMLDSLIPQMLIHAPGELGGNLPSRVHSPYPRR